MNNKIILSIIGFIILIIFSCLNIDSSNSKSSNSETTNTEIQTEGGIVSFSYDDGYDNWYTIGYPLFIAHDYKATFNLNASWTQERSAWIMEMFNDGFEFTSHTYDHNIGVTESNVESMKLLLDNMGILNTGFTGPGGAATPAWGHDEVNIVKQYHTYYSQGYTETGITKPYDIFYLQRYGLSNDSTASDITEDLEYAAANNTWIIISGHSIEGTWIETDPMNGGGDGQSPELIEFVFREIKRLGIQVKTVEEVVHQYYPPGGVIDCSSNDNQEPDLTCFEEGDPQTMDTSVWNEYWHNVNWSGPRFVGSPAVYCHTSNKDLPVMRFHQSIPNGQYQLRVKALLIPYNTGRTYRVYYSFNESTPSQNYVDISEKTEVDLGTVNVNNGEFNLYTKKADILTGSDGYVGWAFIKLFYE